MNIWEYPFLGYWHWTFLVVFCKEMWNAVEDAVNTFDPVIRIPVQIIELYKEFFLSQIFSTAHSSWNTLWSVGAVWKAFSPDRILVLLKPVGVLPLTFQAAQILSSDLTIHSLNPYCEVREIGVGSSAPFAGELIHTWGFQFFQLARLCLLNSLNWERWV